MSSITVALEALEAAVELLGAADVRELSAPERFAAVDRLETALRRQVAISRAQLTHLEQYEGCPPVGIVLADMLRISRREAKRRLRDAEQLAPRTTLTGEPLPPLLPATAKAWEARMLDIEHLRVIQKFFTELPDHVSAAQVDNAERSLAEHAQNLRPDQLEKVAARLAVQLNPDGKFSEQDRARKRGFVWWGGQRPDGMSVGRLTATPELRAMLDAWLAKFAAPGMCTPDGDGERDGRGHGQRQHDALAELVRRQLGDPKLGQHNGLPVTVIVVRQNLCRGDGDAGGSVTVGVSNCPMARASLLGYTLERLWPALSELVQSQYRAPVLLQLRIGFRPASQAAWKIRGRCCTTAKPTLPWHRRRRPIPRPWAGLVTPTRVGCD